MITRIKICCIQNLQEAKTAIGFGASAIGLVAKMRGKSKNLGVPAEYTTGS